MSHLLLNQVIAAKFAHWLYSLSIHSFWTASLALAVVYVTTTVYAVTFLSYFGNFGPLDSSENPVKLSLQDSFYFTNVMASLKVLAAGYKRISTHSVIPDWYSLFYLYRTFSYIPKLQRLVVIFFWPFGWNALVTSSLETWTDNWMWYFSVRPSYFNSSSCIYSCIQTDILMTSTIIKKKCQTALNGLKSSEKLLISLSNVGCPDTLSHSFKICWYC